MSEREGYNRVTSEAYLHLLQVGTRALVPRALFLLLLLLLMVVVIVVVVITSNIVVSIIIITIIRTAAT